MTQQSDPPNPDGDKRAFIAAAEMVAALFDAELPAWLVSEHPDVHDKLFVLIVELEALGYLERYRDGYQATTH